MPRSLRLDAVRERVGDRRVNGGGQDDLAAVRREADARRGVYGDADVAGVGERGTPAVQADSQPHVAPVGPTAGRASPAGSRARRPAPSGARRTPRRRRRRARTPRGRRPSASRRARGGGRRRAAGRSGRSRRASRSVEPSISVSRKVRWPVGSFRCGCSCALMKPMGMIPCFLAARSSRLRARSRAASSSNATWPKRARAFRTCAASLIGRRRRPLESMYAKALSGAAHAPSREAVACSA